MDGTLRGSLGLKSGPLAPTSAKLTSQYLVLDHMSNHYKKISKAKSAIDNKPPKSIQCSQKVRERKQRENIMKYGRPSSRMTNRSLSTPDIPEYYSYQDEIWGEPEDEEDQLVYNIMKATLQRDPEESAQATYGSESQEPRVMSDNFGKTVRHGQTSLLQENLNKMSRPMSARSMGNRSVLSVASRSNLNHLKKPGTYDGDLLEKRAHVFTEPERPFTPRTLKSNRQSRLKEYKYYTPPPKKHDGGVNKDDIYEPKTLPQPKPRKLDESQSGELLETTLMFESLQSRDFSFNKKRQEGVPTLNISVDKDHRNWIKEQASKAHVRMKSERKANDIDPISDLKSFSGEETNISFGKTTKSFDTKPWKSQRLSKVEEEQMYVTFAHEITKDVINSGICTDRVLQQVFERHLQKRKNELSTTRMRTILAQLRMDLCIRKNSIVPDDDDLASELSHLDADNHMGLDNGRNFENTNSQDSTMSYKFNETNEVLSTLRSPRNTDEFKELTSTQTLQQYQMDVTKIDNDSRSEAGRSEKSVASEKILNGHIEDLKSPGEMSQVESEGETLTPTPSLIMTPVSRTVSPTHAPKPRARERRHATREKTNSATDEERLSLKSSESAVSSNIHQKSSRTNMDDANFSDKHELTEHVDSSPITVVKPRARARRRRSSQEAANEIPSNVTSSEEMFATNIHQSVKSTQNNEDRSKSVSQVDSSSEHGVELHRGSKQTSGSQQNELLQRTISRESEHGVESQRGSKQTSGSQQNELLQRTISRESEHGVESQRGSKQTSGSQQNELLQRTISRESVGESESATKEDYENDFEDEYDADEDDLQGDTSHRTSDDDF